MENRHKDAGFAAFATLCLVILLFIGGSFLTVLAKKAKQVRLPAVENRTESFKLVSEDQTKDDLVLRFKNLSTLTITGYTLALGQQTFGADFFPNTAQKGVAPGAIEEVRIPLITLSSQSPEKIIVLTAVFQDPTSAADFQSARLIFDRRQGYATQMRHIRVLLLTAARDSNQNASMTALAVLQQVKNMVSALPEQDDQRPSAGKRSGLNFAKQWTLKQIARLESGEMDVELNRSSNFSQKAEAISKPLGKVSLGLEYIVEKVDEIIAGL